MDFYTADRYLILLSDHNDNFSKYNQKIVTNYSFKRSCSASSRFNTNVKICTISYRQTICQSIGPYLTAILYMLDIVNRMMYTPAFSNFTQDFCKKCVICATYNVSRGVTMPL